MISTSGGLRSITVEDALLPVEEEDPIPEAGCIGIGQEQLPAATPVCSLIEAGLVAGSTRQSQGTLGVPGPDAAEVQFACAGRCGALLPEVASVLAAQYRAAGPLAQTTPPPTAWIPRRPAAEPLSSSSHGPLWVVVWAPAARAANKHIVETRNFMSAYCVCGRSCTVQR